VPPFEVEEEEAAFKATEERVVGNSASEVANEVQESVTDFLENGSKGSANKHVGSNGEADWLSSEE
jgi:hypothetical protein